MTAPASITRALATDESAARWLRVGLERVASKSAGFDQTDDQLFFHPDKPLEDSFASLSKTLSPEQGARLRAAVAEVFVALQCDRDTPQVAIELLNIARRIGAVEILEGLVLKINQCRGFAGIEHALSLYNAAMDTAIALPDAKKRSAEIITRLVSMSGYFHFSHGLNALDALCRNDPDNVAAHFRLLRAAVRQQSETYNVATLTKQAYAKRILASITPAGFAQNCRSLILFDDPIEANDHWFMMGVEDELEIELDFVRVKGSGQTFPIPDAQKRTARTAQVTQKVYEQPPKRPLQELSGMIVLIFKQLRPYGR